MGTGHLCYRYHLGWRSGTFSVKAFIQRWRKYTTGYTRGQTTKDERQTTKPGFVVHLSSLARISLFQSRFKLDELLLQAFGQAVAELRKMLLNIWDFGFPGGRVHSCQFRDVFLWDVQAG